MLGREVNQMETSPVEASRAPERTISTLSIFDDQACAWTDWGRQPLGTAVLPGRAGPARWQCAAHG